jgi:Leucine Rich repeat
MIYGVSPPFLPSLPSRVRVCIVLSFVCCIFLFFVLLLLLPRSVKSSTHLYRLTIIGSTGIRDTDLFHLCEGLKFNKTLTFLEIQSCSSLDCDAAARFGGMLMVNTTLKTLRITSSDMRSAGAIAIVNMLSLNSTLTRLDLTGGKCNTDILPAVGSLLSSSPSSTSALESLTLASMDLGDDGAKQLATSLRSNSKLFQLDLTDCGIGDDGMCAVLDAIAENESCRLDALILAHNQMTSTSNHSLINMLDRTPSLQELDVSHNKIEFFPLQIAFLPELELDGLFVDSPHLRLPPREMVHAPSRSESSDKMLKILEHVRFTFMPKLMSRSLQDS